MRTDRVTVLTYYFENSCQSAGKDSQEKKAQLDFDRQYTTQVKYVISSVSYTLNNNLLNTEI